jgi:hypothetical protein
MMFTLHYSGPLRANGRPDHKHELRRAFHAQLAELWRHEPLSHMKSHFRPRDSPDRKPWETVCLLRQLGQYTFVPVVSEELKFVASVDVTVLRPEQPGRLLVQGGDMDNRLKTLFDALAIPQHENQLPPGAAPEANETPFYCVLEDDSLVTSVAVHTEHLLTPGVDSSHVVLLVRVDVTARSRIGATMAIV